MRVPSSPEGIAAAMDPWEAANGPTDLYDELVAHAGRLRADDLWTQACSLYDALGRARTEMDSALRG